MWIFPRNFLKHVFIKLTPKDLGISTYLHVTWNDGRAKPGAALQTALLLIN